MGGRTEGTPEMRLGGWGPLDTAPPPVHAASASASEAARGSGRRAVREDRADSVVVMVTSGIARPLARVNGPSSAPVAIAGNAPLSYKASHGLDCRW